MGLPLLGKPFFRLHKSGLLRQERNAPSFVLKKGLVYRQPENQENILILTFMEK
jgi:hypothetical protein